MSALSAAMSRVDALFLCEHVRDRLFRQFGRQQGHEQVFRIPFLRMRVPEGRVEAQIGSLAQQDAHGIAPGAGLEMASIKVVLHLDIVTGQQVFDHVLRDHRGADIAADEVVIPFGHTGFVDVGKDTVAVAIPITPCRPRQRAAYIGIDGTAASGRLFADEGKKIVPLQLKDCRSLQLDQGTLRRVGINDNDLRDGVIQKRKRRAAS
ncbi:hypothetical protein J2T09_000315 [Neorhizobium huautlense]|uniref:Uncharacterized protein n=1 Tax=Neorhizobium huautlense TaxID=67774 RepID=A0ABT9PM85_9HYPH|nr:hypothetical protein [Neorhizobium huautlense]MDP9835574.1 hypothetical protein [Neorhizobium huautlense]